MPYTPPVWGILSGEHDAMLETGISDLDVAKERVWHYFDGGDESVLVIPVCPAHPDRQLSSVRGIGCTALLNGDIDHVEEAL